MAIICSSYNTSISTSNKLVCGYLVKIYNMQPLYNDIIDIMVDDTVYWTISTGGDARQYLNVIFTFRLISKNITNNTAVIDMVESSNPCTGITCPDTCVGVDLYSQRCRIDYDVSNIPVGYTCVPDTLKNENSSLCTSYTHILEFRIRPWGWYTPDGAASELIKKLNDINGWCLNLVSDFTDWEYIGTDIVNDGSDVLLRCKFKNILVTSKSIKPLVSNLVASIILVIGTLLLTLGSIGLITGWKFLEPEVEPDKSPTYVPPPKEQLPGINNAINDADTNCLTGLPVDPTCANLNNYAICLDSVHIGVYGTLKSVYPNFVEFQTTYNEYLNKYVELVSSCNPDIPGSTPSDIQQKIIKTQQDYIKELEEDFEKLQDLYESSLCCIELPYIGCIISKELCDTAKTAAYVVVGGAVIYLGYNIYTSMQPPKKQV